jgi:hypothetical protein
MRLLNVNSVVLHFIIPQDKEEQMKLEHKAGKDLQVRASQADKITIPLISMGMISMGMILYI